MDTTQSATSLCVHLYIFTEFIITIETELSRTSHIQSSAFESAGKCELIPESNGIIRARDCFRYLFMFISNIAFNLSAVSD
jgi:hypothetical protein